MNFYEQRAGVAAGHTVALFSGGLGICRAEALVVEGEGMDAERDDECYVTGETVEQFS